MIREFTIHILQSLHFLQNMEPIQDEEVQSRLINLDLKKIGKDKNITKLLIFDLDETLAHCVRSVENAERAPDIKLNIRL